jgi:hypothetical protein
MAAASALLLQPSVARSAESARVSRQGLLPLELIFEHLLNHRDQMLLKRGNDSASPLLILPPENVDAWLRSC